ncbi:MAG: putative ATP-dependent endonuclease of OLD family, partial [Arcobacteraceae bacterium]
MSISSIKITNLLSFDNVSINDFKDINCIVGMNNAGKSNFLKLILFFYDKINNKRVLSPALNSNYTPYGTISITYNMDEIRNIVIKKKNIGKSDMLSAIFNTFFSDNSFKNIVKNSNQNNLISSANNLKEYTLTLSIFKNESIEWSTKDRKILKFINYLYPFFYINTRDIDLHDWTYIWEMVSKIKTYKTKNITQKSFTDFINKEMSSSTKNKHTKFGEDIDKITNIIKKYNLDLSSFSYNEKLINFIKSGLEGHDFNFNGEDVNMQSDGTNSSNYIQVFISLLITLSRREYIIPALYIDEPEIGLHPKKSEELIYNIYDLYTDLNLRGSIKQYPHILFSTHSPNILKVIIKLFEKKQQVLHFAKAQNSKNANKNTKISKLKSTYNDVRFLNRFTDNEARLFFSKFILFVEGETELELFGHKKLLNYF